MRKTTFVLGAGFSNYYGYPLGSNLIHLISDLMHTNMPEYFKDIASEAHIKEFAKTILPYGPGSIDFFLKEKPHLKDIGYAAASYVLLRHEDSNPRHLWGQESFNPYWAIIKSLGDLTNLPPDTINVITFNYDRTFEHFCMEHISSRYSLQVSDAKAVFEKINYAHAYGQLGYLPWQVAQADWNSVNSLTLPYAGAPKASMEQIKVAIKRIGTVYNQELATTCETDRIASERFARALRMLKTSDNIYFLGFGYLEENMKALDFQDIDKKKKYIYGTSINLSEVTRSELASKYWIDTTAGEHIDACFSNGHLKFIHEPPASLEPFIF